MGFFRDRWRRPADDAGPHRAPHGTPPRTPGADPHTRPEDESADDLEAVLVEQVGAHQIGAPQAGAAQVGAGQADAGQATDTPHAPGPLTMARIVDWISDYGYSYFIDSDGDIGGMWHSRLYYFLLFGGEREILQVRGQWNRDITIDRIEEVLEFCNEWNTDRIWPKAYFRVRDNGMIQVYGEMSVDFEHGADDAQLDQVLTCGLSTGAMLFDALDAHYPDPAQVAP